MALLRGLKTTPEFAGFTRLIMKTPTKGRIMPETTTETRTEQELINDLKSAQKTRREIVKDLKREDNTTRENKTLLKTLELVHKTIMLISLNLDVVRVTPNLDQ